MMNDSGTYFGLLCIGVTIAGPFIMLFFFYLYEKYNALLDRKNVVVPSVYSRLDKKAAEINCLMEDVFRLGETLIEVRNRTTFCNKEVNRLEEIMRGAIRGRVRAVTVNCALRLEREIDHFHHYQKFLVGFQQLYELKLIRLANLLNDAEAILEQARLSNCYTTAKPVQDVLNDWGGRLKMSWVYWTDRDKFVQSLYERTLIVCQIEPFQEQENLRRAELLIVEYEQRMGL